MSRLGVTPEMVEAAYELLRLSPPFRRWKLPAGDGIEFHVTRHGDRYGDCERPKDGKPPIIRISSAKVLTMDRLVRTMAHEMVHLYLEGKDRRIRHGAIFWRHAKQVCRVLDFDEEEF